MIKEKNKNLISDDQLLRFSDSIGTGASFDKAFADAGFFLSDKKAYAELETFFKLEHKLRRAKTSIVLPIAFAEHILEKISVSPSSSIGEVPSSTPIVSHYSVLDKTVRMFARPSWKIGAPIAVMFLALSTILSDSARRDSSIVLAPRPLVTSSQTETLLSMNLSTLKTDTQDVAPSTSLAINNAPANRKMPTQVQGVMSVSNEADPTPKTLESVLAMLTEEAESDVGFSRSGDGDIAIDLSGVSRLEQPYDETTI